MSKQVERNRKGYVAQNAEGKFAKFGEVSCHSTKAHYRMYWGPLHDADVIMNRDVAKRMKLKEPEQRHEIVQWVPATLHVVREVALVGPGQKELS